MYAGARAVHAMRDEVATPVRPFWAQRMQQSAPVGLLYFQEADLPAGDARADYFFRKGVIQNVRLPKVNVLREVLHFEAGICKFLAVNL